MQLTGTPPSKATGGARLHDPITDSPSLMLSECLSIGLPLPSTKTQERGGSAETKGLLSGPIPRIWIVLMLLGILTLIAGLVVSSSSNFLITRTDRYESTCDRNLVKNVVTVGTMLIQSGALVLVLGMFLGGATSPSLERGPRASLFIAGALVLIFSMWLPGLLLPAVYYSC